MEDNISCYFCYITT